MEARTLTTTSRHFTQSPPNSRKAVDKPSPARRRRHALQQGLTSKLSMRLHTLFSALFFLIMFSTTLATGHGRSGFELRRPLLEARRHEVLFDPRVPPRPQLHERQLDLTSTADGKKTTKTSAAAENTKASSTTMAKVASSSMNAQSASSSTSSSDSTSIESAPTPTLSSLPRVFDGGIGTNYTQPSCPNFLMSMINNATFASCLPFSLLLQNSISFFAASRSASTLDSVISASCNVVFPTCSAVVASYATTLRSSNGCADDYNRQNPTVRQAYNGLLAYDTLYKAACLKPPPSDTANANANTNEYCFTRAVTNTSSPTDSYIYYLPLGLPLPAGAIPSCTTCLKQTMTILATAAANKSQPITLTYVNAAQMINLQCGPGFVNQSVPGAGKGSSSSMGSVSASSPPWTHLLASTAGTSILLLSGFFVLL